MAIFVVLDWTVLRIKLQRGPINITLDRWKRITKGKTAYIIYSSKCFILGSTGNDLLTHIAKVNCIISFLHLGIHADSVKGLNTVSFHYVNCFMDTDTNCHQVCSTLCHCGFMTVTTFMLRPSRLGCFPLTDGDNHYYTAGEGQELYIRARLWLLCCVQLKRICFKCMWLRTDACYYWTSWDETEFASASNRTVVVVPKCGQWSGNIASIGICWLAKRDSNRNSFFYCSSEVGLKLWKT